MDEQLFIELLTCFAEVLRRTPLRTTYLLRGHLVGWQNADPQFFFPILGIRTYGGAFQDWQYRVDCSTYQSYTGNMWGFGAFTVFPFLMESCNSSIDWCWTEGLSDHACRNPSRAAPSASMAIFGTGYFRFMETFRALGPSGFRFSGEDFLLDSGQLWYSNSRKYDDYGEWWTTSGRDHRMFAR